VNVLEINKYRPSLFKHGRFLRDDWTSCTQIGTFDKGAPLDISEYRRVEDRYVRALHRFISCAAVEKLFAHNMEHWDSDNEMLHRLGLDDVLDTRPAPVEDEVIAGSRLDNIARRCLREAAWLELVHPKNFLVHFGYDLRLLVAMEGDPKDAIAETQADGLFVYPGNSRLPTLDEWRGLTGDDRGHRPLDKGKRR